MIKIENKTRALEATLTKKNFLSRIFISSPSWQACTRWWGALVWRPAGGGEACVGEQDQKTLNTKYQGKGTRVHYVISVGKNKVHFGSCNFALFLTYSFLISNKEGDSYKYLFRIAIDNLSPRTSIAIVDSHHCSPMLIITDCFMVIIALVTIAYGLHFDNHFCLWSSFWSLKPQGWSLAARPSHCHAD